MDKLLALLQLAGSNVVESAAIVMEFAAAPHAPKHGPGDTHRNTVTTPNTLNSACADGFVPAH